MMELRPYQEEQAEALISDEHILLESPTGSGKTVTVCYSAIALSKAGKKVIIATPLKGSVDQFDQTIRKLGGDVEIGNRKSIQIALRHMRDKIIVCTHQALRNAWDNSVLAENTYLFIDESHHAGDEQVLGEVCKEFVDAGGKLRIITASPFRADGKLYLPDDYRTVRRSLFEHMNQGYAPRLVKSAIVTFPLSKISKDEFRGDSISEDATEIVAEEMFKNWVLTKRKTVICFPSCKQTSKLVDSIIARFAVGGARVLNAYGSIAAVRENFESKLALERDGRSSDSQVDVIVGCNRVYESMDWPHCSQAFCYGATTSPVKVLQLLGRTLRLKDSDASLNERSESRVVFFLPSKDGTIASFNKWHIEQSLLVCGLVYDATKAKLWGMIEKAMQMRLPNTNLDQHKVLKPHGKERMNYLALFRLSVQQLEMENRMTRPSDVRDKMIEIAESGNQPYDHEKIRQIVVEHSLGLEDRYLDLEKNQFEKWPDESMRDILDSIIESFSKSVVLESVSIQGITLTPSLIELFGKKLNGLIPEAFYKSNVYDHTWNRGFFGSESQHVASATR
jgi:superfamily II DNA or RNA helicase